nr:SLC13 family permease [Planctomycetota bacterium]
VVVVFCTLGAAILLFVTEWLRVDVVALLVLITLALTGIVSEEEALGGFSNEAVITMAAVLVLSGGLQRTGIANLLGSRVLAVAGRGEARLTAVLMLTVGLLSGIMNDIAVTALMLPVVVSMSRRLKLSPSKLLMPLAFGSLLGGMTTLIGTAPNILVSGLLQDTGNEAFTMFDFTPIGLCALVAGVAYMVLIGRRLLPERHVGREDEDPSDAQVSEAYELGHRIFTVRIPHDSALANTTLKASRLHPALGWNVLAINHEGEPRLAPGPDAELRGGDTLVVQGRMERYEEVRGWGSLELLEGTPALDGLESDDIGFVEIVLGEGDLAGTTLFDVEFRDITGLRVLAIAHGRRREARLTRLEALPLAAGDRLLAMGPRAYFGFLRALDGLTAVTPLEAQTAAETYDLTRRLMRVRVPAGSGLSGCTLAETNLRDACALTVVGIERAGVRIVLPEPSVVLEEGDVLDIEGRLEELNYLGALQALEVDEGPAPKMESLQSSTVGIGEVVLAPRSEITGKTVRGLHFRERFGLSVIAVWRGGRAYRSNLRDFKLKLGDALLVYGPRDRIAQLHRQDDFIVISGTKAEPFRTEKGPIAAMIMGAVLVTVAFGLVPIWLAALCGATLMTVTRCLKPGEMYEHIEWKAIILVAGMLTLGLAMETSGAAVMIADNVLMLLKPMGPRAVMAGIFLVSALAAYVMPTAAVAVLMSRIVLSDAAGLGVDPQSAAMCIAIASSCAFMSPVGHPVNLLVMGMGGYRFTDYTKVGIGLMLVVFAVVMVVLPIFWPLAPVAATP